MLNSCLMRAALCTTLILVLRTRLNASFVSQQPEKIPFMLRSTVTGLI